MPAPFFKPGVFQGYWTARPHTIEESKRAKELVQVEEAQHNTALLLSLPCRQNTPKFIFQAVQLTQLEPSRPFDSRDARAYLGELTRTGIFSHTMSNVGDRLFRE